MDVVLTKPWWFSEKKNQAPQLLARLEAILFTDLRPSFRLRYNEIYDL
jgi:hypothetical protein